MRPILCWLLLIVLLGPALWAEEQGVPEADALLRQCVATLPDVPIRVPGQLQGRRADGELEKRVLVDMTIDWQATPPTARYSTKDAFGKALEHLAVTWHPDQPPEYRFFKGDPLVGAPLPPLTDAIEETDATWMDLTLAFLWWKGGRTMGSETLRGRECWIVELPAPPDHFAAAARVRLWIDAKMGGVLRAFVLDASGQELRRVDVKGFKKINDRWFVQVIEIQTIATRHTTTLRVRDVEDRERKTFIKIDEGGPDLPAAEDRVDPIEE